MHSPAASIPRIVAVLGIIFFASGFFVFIGGRLSNGEAHARSQVSRAKADLRSLATAIDAYSAQNKTTPPMMPMSSVGIDPDELKSAGTIEFSTIDTVLTTPIAYIATLPLDVTSRSSKFPIAYWTDGKKYLLYCMGPDRHFNIRKPEKITNASNQLGTIDQIDFVYDPTNGISSEGDVVHHGEIIILRH